MDFWDRFSWQLFVKYKPKRGFKQEMLFKDGTVVERIANGIKQ